VHEQRAALSEALSEEGHIVSKRTPFDKRSIFFYRVSLEQLIMNRHLDAADLKEVRDNTDWRDLFHALGIQKDDRKSREDDWWGYSPFNPDERTPSFHVNDNGWYCHSTSQGGGPVELVQRLQGCNCYEAGKWLLENGVSHLQRDTRGRARRAADTTPAGDPDASEEKKNPPIRQDLKPQLRTDHPEFQARDIPAAVLEELGIGYFAGSSRSRSPLKERIVFQIRGVRSDNRGNLSPVILSHIGRATTNEQAEEEGKWLFYAGFHSSLELYNQDMLFLDKEAQRQVTDTQRVVLVEGCFDVAKLYSAGIRNAVASFGAHASHEQVSRLREIAEHAGVNRVLVFFDRDQDGSEPNREGAQRVARQLTDAGFDAAVFDWNARFADRRRGEVGIPQPITDPCEFTVEQLKWLRRQGLV